MYYNALLLLCRCPSVFLHITKKDGVEIDIKFGKISNPTADSNGWHLISGTCEKMD